jgi:hypothetical protein
LKKKQNVIFRKVSIPAQYLTHERLREWNFVRTHPATRLGGRHLTL